MASLQENEPSVGCTVYTDGKQRCCLTDPLMAYALVCLIFVCVVQPWFARHSFRNLMVPLHHTHTVLSLASLGSSILLLSFCSVQNQQKEPIREMFDLYKRHARLMWENDPQRREQLTVLLMLKVTLPEEGRCSTKPFCKLLFEKDRRKRKFTVLCTTPGMSEVSPGTEYRVQSS